MSVFTDNIIDGYIRWNKNNMISKNFTCGYCGAYISSDKGMSLIDQGRVNPTESIGVHICTNCYIPTLIHDDIQIPGNRYGVAVSGVPKNVNDVYEEARSRYGANAFTGVVLLCRKLLMHVAVDLGAKDNLKFVEYVNYLNENHFVSVKSHDWVDQTREYGNEATHEIQVNIKEDAQKIIKFCEMILRMNYEYPSEISDSNDGKNNQFYND